MIFAAFVLLCLSTLVLASVRFYRRAFDQERSFDNRFQQHLLEHMPQLPRPAVRVWYGPSDVQTHISVPSRRQLLDQEARP